MDHKGVVVLPTMLILGAIIIGIVLAGVFVIQLINRSTFSVRLEAEVAAIAKAAAQDASLRLLRGELIINQICPNFSAAPDYSLPAAIRTSADVYLCRTDCGPSTCQYEAKIDARANVFVRRRFMMVLDTDAITGQVRSSALRSVKF